MGRPVGQYADWSMQFVDAGNETSTMRGSAAVLTGGEEGNFSSQVALWNTFRNATLALVLGDIVRYDYCSTNEAARNVPTNGAARELKLLVQYEHLTNGKRYTLTVPTLNPTIPAYVDNINARDVVRVDTPSAITDFIDAFEDFVVAPDVPAALVGEFGQAVKVVGLKVVGRNI